MKLILVTLVACAFAAQDTTPPVISLTLPAAAGADASGDTHNFHHHGVKDYSSSAATECTAGASYATCAEPSCEAHDHHDQSVECNKPKKYLIKQHADAASGAESMPTATPSVEVNAVPGVVTSDLP